MLAESVDLSLSECFHATAVLNVVSHWTTSQAKTFRMRFSNEWFELDVKSQALIRNIEEILPRQKGHIADEQVVAAAERAFEKGEVVQ